ncbi:HAD family hydrolase [Candidatus Woesearchaeota archaeon]|nr:HAD family hydrolase [Candidatus Woesearchaeota archaeon]
MTKKIKLIFFDMEGVIFEPGIKEERAHVAASIWTVIARELGKECQEEENKGKIMWAEGKFKNYLEWCEYSIEYHKKHGLTMKKFYDIINKVEYVPRTKETFKELKNRGYKTVVITGGFKNLANRAIRDLDIDHTFAATEYFFDENTGKVVSWNILPSDYEGKIDFMRLMMREYGLHPSECAFICEGVNDIPLAKEVGLSIAFNGRKELEKITTHSINQPDDKKDLRAILPFFK